MHRMKPRPLTRLALGLLPLLALPVGCMTWSTEGYLQRIGMLQGEQNLIDQYKAAIGKGELGPIAALFDQEPAGQAAATAAINDLRTKLGPAAAPGAKVDLVEAEVRDFDLFAEPPSANFYFYVGARTGDGVRHLVRIESKTTFKLLKRDPPEGDAEGLPVAHLAILSQEEFTSEVRDGTKPHYEDATAKSGLTDRHCNQSIDKKCLILQGTMPGSGAAAADFDGDGRLDLAAIDGVHSRLYVNRGDGTFVDHAKEWGIDTLSGAGCVAADYDNDGDQDLYVLDHFHGARLYRNDGGHFTDATVESGAVSPDPSFSASFGDVDRDGDLDLYVPCAGDYYSEIPMPPFDARDGRPDKLFINDGHGHFTEEGKERGVADVGWGLCAAFCDYDEDGDDDVYLANDFGVNGLFQNDGTGHFKNVAEKVGAEDRGYGMGISWGDVDNDGHFDAYVSDIYSEFNPIFLDPDYPLPFLGRMFRWWVGPKLHAMGLGNALLYNKGNGAFADLGKKWHVNEAGWAWGGMFLDFDNDADLDIYCPDGSYTGPSAEDLELRFWALSSLMWQKSKMKQWLFDAMGRSLQGHEYNRLFEQRGSCDFAEVGYLNDVNAIETARGFALGDFDDDGYPDLYLRNLNDRCIYYRNTGGGNHWLRFVLVGVQSNRDGVGAVLRAKTASATQLRQVTAGEGFYSSHDKRPLFGLGAATAADVEIKWPSGRIDRFEQLAADKNYLVKEGSGVAAPFTPKPLATSRADAPAAAPATASAASGR